MREAPGLRIEATVHGVPVARYHSRLIGRFFRRGGHRALRGAAGAVEAYRAMKRAEDAGPHILTGPVHVEGAQPGDMLEVRILEVGFRVPYGVNSTGPGCGVLPELLAQPVQKIIELDLERRVALFSTEVEVPLAPFRDRAHADGAGLRQDARRAGAQGVTIPEEREDGPKPCRADARLPAV